MADERCPLCMEKLKNGECMSCGYKLPDEENISSIYDYEPAEYPEPEPAIREITPEVQMEEIYPNRAETPMFKVRDDEGHTVRSRIDLTKPSSKPDNNPYANATDSNPNASNGNPNASDGNPYAGYTPDGVPNKTSGSPFANQSVYSSVDTESTEAFWKKYWWLLLLSFFAPIVGIILNSTMKNELKQYKANYLVIIAIVLGFIFPP
ncbi:MAG: hypothetical protein J6K17_11235 [Oscillospiraceae bacterium]|nr:hypothetical protein [Oscillospiraceae bacterium]